MKKKLDQDTYSLTFTPGTRGNLRCHCCNRVNNESIADFPEDITRARMVIDPYDKTKVYCMDCVDEMDLANSEWFDDEE